MRTNTTGSKSILKEFLTLIKQLQQKGGMIQNVQRKHPHFHENKYISEERIDEKTLKLELFGYENTAQTITLLFATKKQREEGERLINLKNADLLQIAS